MDAPPEGFTLLPGADRGGGTNRVFGVSRDGVDYVCKRLGPRALSEAWMRERLVGEGRILDGLRGGAAPRLVAAGQDEHGPWIVMERVPWASLLARVGASDAAWIAAATRTAFATLARVHEAGVVHGDLSPSNILVAEDGRAAALVDFGLAVGPGMPAMTPGPFRGTVAYAAPEVVRGEPFDARADLFALAVSLLHALSGTLPRSAPGPAPMLLAAGDQPIDAWAESSSRGLPPEIVRMLVGCCAFGAEDRPASAVAVRDAVASAVG
jgi:serine/threonine-protein kinase